jgi:TRAP-type C4-dicarboxylate transport system substrate-binding protein
VRRSFSGEEVRTDKSKGGKIMKKISVFMTILMMAFLVISAVGVDTAMAQKKPIVIRLVVPAPPNDWPLTYKDLELAKRFNERAKGEYVMEVHAGGALAKLPEYFDAVRIGAVEMADSPWAVYSFLDPRLGAIEIPFLFDNSNAQNSAIKLIEPLYDQIFQEKFNAKGFGLLNSGGMQLFSTKPVKTLEDWKGLLVGAISPPIAGMIKELGGSPVTIMWVDMYEAMQKKVVDANTQGTHGGLILGLPEVCKYITIFFGIALWNGYTINLDVWKKMPGSIQKILQEEVDKAADWMTKTTCTVVGDGDIKAFKEKGMDVYFLPKAERERWKKQLEPYKQKQLDSMGELGQKIKKIADEANKKHPYSQRALY